MTGLSIAIIDGPAADRAQAVAALQTHAKARQERTAKIQIGSRGNQWMKTQGNANGVHGYDAWNVAVPGA